jgi:hypothetical protein
MRWGPFLQLALAGVSFTVGREGESEYNESLAGRLVVPNSEGGHQFPGPLNYTWPNGTLLPMIFAGAPGVVGQGDAKEEAYNFRMCLSSDPHNQVSAGSRQAGGARGARGARALSLLLGSARLRCWIPVSRVQSVRALRDGYDFSAP